MSSTRGPPCIERWQRLEREYLDKGLPRYRAHQLIADLYAVHPSTVYLHLTPASLERRREYETLHNKSPARRYQRSNFMAGYRQRPEVRERSRDYDRRYKQMYRQLSALAGQLGVGTSHKASSQIVTEEVFLRTGIRVRLATVSKALGRPRMSPI